MTRTLNSACLAAECTEGELTPRQQWVRAHHGFAWRVTGCEAVWAAGGIRGQAPFMILANIAAPPPAGILPVAACCCEVTIVRSEEHTSELQSLMRISYAVFCLKKKNKYNNQRMP